MKFPLVCVLFVGLWVFPHHSDGLARRGLRKSHKSDLGIYDGKTTTPEKYPYVVAILENNNFTCAGTIVSDRWIVTVADCLINSQVSALTVVTGSSDTNNGAVYDVVEVVNHSDYNSQTYDYNYALVKVNGTFTWSDTTQAAKLPSSKLCPYSSTTVVGYGQTESQSSGSAQLREGTMEWWPRYICKSYYQTVDITLTDRIACAYNAAKTTLCTGDLADPFVQDGVLYGQFILSPTKGACSYTASPVLVADIYPVTSWLSNMTGASYDDA